MGAEMAGNADGTIPDWNPSSMVASEGFEPFSVEYPNPYADEQPLFTIDGSKWQEHAEFLTEGTRTIFVKLGNDGFKMDIYPSHRNHVPTQWIADNTAKNATGATLTEDVQKD